MLKIVARPRVILDSGKFIPSAQVTIFCDTDGSVADYPVGALPGCHPQPSETIALILARAYLQCNPPPVRLDNIDEEIEYIVG